VPLNTHIKKMRVKKRDGTYQPVDFNKISNRIKFMVEGIDSDGIRIGEKLSIDPNEIAKDVCALIVDGISTCQLDEFAAELCAYKVGDHYHYDILGSRIIISNHHKNTDKYRNFSDMVGALYKNKDIHGKPAPLVSRSFYETTMASKDILNDVVNKNHNRDYECLDYFGFKTLEKSYLLKVKTVDPPIQERYQHLLMREALAMYEDDIDKAIECYELLSQSMFTHATPTLFNSGTQRPQLSSCFLIGMDDSIDGMYECIRRLSHISKWAGGIGVWLSKIRGSGSLIRGTNGESSGILPLIKVINEFARHVNQGGKRKGSVALYIEPWHKDVFAFLDMKKNQGAEEMRARDLFYGLWIPDIFMRRVKRALTLKRVTGTHDIKWSLMCPDDCPGLADCYGDEFDELYTKYEQEGRYHQQIDILVLWQAILDSQKETGLPYMCYKDHVNKKSNQKNIGIIRSSNLCTEIMEYSDHEEYAICNLASINLKKMVIIDGEERRFDYDLLYKITKQVTRNLNRIIDRSFYPISQAKKSNFRHRPIGIGVQGLADAFILMNLPFESEGAQQLNRDIFETIYFAALSASNELAEERQKQLEKVPIDVLNKLKKCSSYIDYYENYFNDLELKNRQKLTRAEQEIKERYLQDYEILCQEASKIIENYQLPKHIAEYQYMNIDNSQYLGAYSTFVGSPAHEGTLHYDFYGVKPSGRWNFDVLKAAIMRYGLRNSLLVALMPTATTAQILGSNECIEPLTSNIYTRQVLAGTFLRVNHYLQKILTDMGLWTPELKDKILLNGGSIQDIDEIPDDLKDLFKTAWSMSKKVLINMAADRAAWIDQSQSFNHFISDPNDDLLTTVHIYGWERGLKTGMYYLRRETLVDPEKFSIDMAKYQDQLKRNIYGQDKSPTTSPSPKNSQSPEKTACNINDPNCTTCGT